VSYAEFPCTYAAVDVVPDAVRAGVERPEFVLSVSGSRVGRRRCMYVQLHGESSGKDATKHGDVASEERAVLGVSVNARRGGQARGACL
jgi:hypothetical protein